MDDFNPFGLFNGVWIPEFLLSYSGISPAAKICYARLCRYCGRKTNICFPSLDELADELGVTTRSINSYLRELEDDGFLVIQRRGMQMTNKYRLKKNRVIKEFLGETLSDQDRKNPSDQDMKNSSDQDRKDLSGPTYSSEESQNIRESLLEQVFSSGEFTISERLTPDVVKEIQYSDVDEIELPDEGLKSKTQMPSGDQRKFWTHWNRMTGLRPDAREKQRHKFWLAKQSYPDSITAINGYEMLNGHKSVRAHSMEEFKSKYYECLKAGKAEERATTPPTPSVSPTTISPPTIDPGAPWGPSRAIARWNELVISNPVAWDWDRDDGKDLKKALADPMFEKRFEELCTKAEADPNKSRDFQWMITSYGKKAGNWFRYLNQKEAPRFKSQDSHEEMKRKLIEKRFGNGN